jgi:hypothetical protein
MLENGERFHAIVVIGKCKKDTYPLISFTSITFTLMLLLMVVLLFLWVELLLPT